MSIYVEIASAVRSGQLFLHYAAMPGGLMRRKMYISSEIRSLLTGPWASVDLEERCGYLRADLDRFVEGGIVPVAQTPYGGKTSYLKRLDPARDEIWEIRSRAPKPALRVFGRFIAKNTFVALTCYLRADLGGPGAREWRNAMVECGTEWRKLFPVYEPLSGANLDEYVDPLVLV